LAEGVGEIRSFLTLHQRSSKEKYPTENIEKFNKKNILKPADK